MNQFENAHERVDVTLIRRLAADGTPIDLIAEQFFLSPEQVERILAGETLDDVETVDIPDQPRAIGARFPVAPERASGEPGCLLMTSGHP